jgi:hypothetical protein
MIKTLNNNQIALDKSDNIVYNTDMTNNDTNTNNKTFSKGTTDMANVAHDVRVIKHIDGAYDVHANFPTVQGALDYMRRMGFANDSWYIVNADGVRLRMTDAGKLTVFNSLIG